MLSKLWRLLRRRTPAQHHAAATRRLAQAENYERAAEAELRRLRSRHGDSRAARRAARVLKRLRRRTRRARGLLRAASQFV